MLSSIAKLLQLSIPSHRIRVFGPVSSPVVRVARPPLPEAIAADVAVFGIGCDLLPVIVGAALTLTDSFTANRLKGLKLRRLKRLLTVAAAPFPHNSRCRTVPGSRTKKFGPLFLVE